MNLLLNDEGVIKLGDFGVSRQMSESPGLLSSQKGHVDLPHPSFRQRKITN